MKWSKKFGIRIRHRDIILSITPERGAAYTLLSLEALLSGFSFPSEGECRQLADELKKNPPSDLTPEGLSLVLQILRGEGEEEEDKFVL